MDKLFRYDDSMIGDWNIKDHSEDYFLFLQSYCKINREEIKNKISSEEKAVLLEQYAQGDIMAICKLAVACPESDDEEKNYYMYKFATESGYAWAWNTLGVYSYDYAPEYAMECFKYAASEDDNLAKHNLAVCYFKNKENIEEAVEILKKNVEDGEVYSAVMLIIILLFQGNESESMYYYDIWEKWLSNNNNTDIYDYYLIFYYTKLLEYWLFNGKHDYMEKGLKLLADRRENNCFTEMGMRAEIASEYKLAMYYYKLGDKCGDLYSKRSIALMYFYGFEEYLNLKGGIYKACEIINNEPDDYIKSDALVILGLARFYGDYLTQDYGLACKLMEEAVSLNKNSLSLCGYELFVCYYEDKGVRLRDYNKAFEYARYVVDLNKPFYPYKQIILCEKLGDMCCDGIGCNENKRRGGDYYKRTLDLLEGKSDCDDIIKRVKQKLDHLIRSGKWSVQMIAKDSFDNPVNNVEQTYNELMKAYEINQGQLFAIKCRDFVTYMVNDLLEQYNIKPNANENGDVTLSNQISALDNLLSKKAIDRLHMFRKLANERGAHVADIKIAGVGDVLGKEEMYSYLKELSELLDMYNKARK